MLTVNLIDLKKKQKAGAALLDAHFGNPKWRKTCEGMQIRDCDDCIMARLFGDYSNGCAKLDILGSDYGFDFRVGIGSKENYDALQKMWEDEFANPPLGTDD